MNVLPCAQMLCSRQYANQTPLRFHLEASDPQRVNHSFLFARSAALRARALASASRLVALWPLTAPVLASMILYALPFSLARFFLTVTGIRIRRERPG